jgi:hypothetical protein
MPNELYDKLTSMGIPANIKHLQRLIGSRRNDGTDESIIAGLAEKFGGFDALRDVLETIEKKKSA